MFERNWKFGKYTAVVDRSWGAKSNVSSLHINHDSRGFLFLKKQTLAVIYILSILEKQNNWWLFIFIYGVIVQS
jgi:hypothetical protein